ncbi:neuronal acetylcholine receptor subunit alpha-7-like [Camelus ferus]|uniref:Neuronal acetylcholine receptor subunit alpha-7-like n=1 Tax=Camelus ferus TaxID=419612 RepID=A0A8B8S507_CAMFR|nr:neuronal acetylcholine receptor subunit alpha-7-like [Camelus ferus]
MRGSVCLALVASLLHVSLQGEFQRKLYKDLVKNYNPLERPVANDSQPLTVYFSLSLLQIMDVVCLLSVSLRNYHLPNLLKVK